MAAKPNNQQLFLNWLKKRDPFMYAVAMRVNKLKSDKGAGMGSWSSIFSGAFNAIKDIAPKVVEYSQTKKLLDLQVKRASQNLPPLDLPSYQASVPNFNPAQPAAANQIAQQYVQNPQSFSNNNTILYLAGAGVLGFLLLNRRGKRR